MLNNRHWLSKLVTGQKNNPNFGSTLLANFSIMNREMERIRKKGGKKKEGNEKEKVWDNSAIESNYYHV